MSFDSSGNRLVFTVNNSRRRQLAITDPVGSSYEIGVTWTITACNQPSLISKSQTKYFNITLYENTKFTVQD